MFGSDFTQRLDHNKTMASFGFISKSLYSSFWTTVGASTAMKNLDITEDFVMKVVIKRALVLVNRKIKGSEFRWQRLESIPEERALVFGDRRIARLEDLDHRLDSIPGMHPDKITWLKRFHCLSCLKPLRFWDGKLLA
jgi:hypothetical protein